jgi:hypothetical protein
MRERRISTTLIALVATLLIVATLAAVMTDGRASSRKETASNLQPAPQGQDSKRVTLVRVFIHEFDLYPDLIRVKPGKVLIRAENEKQTEVALVVEQVGPGQARQQTARVAAARHLRRADQGIALGVGEYIFYEESNPSLKGTLIVEPD